MRVTNDLFDIANRILEIDPDFEVHLEDEYKILLRGHLVLTTSILDERVLWKVGQDVDMDKIQTHNAKVSSSAQKELDIALGQLSEMLDFASQTSREVSFKKPRRSI
ncbi:MAG: hypothetical protein FWE31_04515 [Firmicutes bacterium]|nr:hypothetical protein [Bacillota bacterium]